MNRSVDPRIRIRLERGINRLWYRARWRSWPLWPLSALFCAIVVVRRWRLVRVQRKKKPSPVPVVVVGNITTGGTGKTPLVVAIVRHLRQAGYSPGVITRGYGGRSPAWPQRVVPDSDPRWVGDEPVMLARSCACPVVAGPDRMADLGLLVSSERCDVVVSDDGLQHYRLPRDVEIAVLDGERGLGNRLCLPAGPLREPSGRLRQVDFVVINGGGDDAGVPMQLAAAMPVNLTSGEQRPLSAFADAQVHAIAGIGNPERFFTTLKRAGLQILEHPFPDHYDYHPHNLDFGDDRALIMTEKDAVKCAGIAPANAWYLPVEAVLPDSFFDSLVRRIQSRRRSGRSVVPAEAEVKDG